MSLSKKYNTLLNKVPRRTNECWFGNMEARSLCIYGHNFILVLEGAGLRIWQLMDGSKTINELVDQLCREFSADRDVILEDTLKFVIKLENAGVAAWRSRPLFEDVILHD